MRETPWPDQVLAAASWCAAGLVVAVFGWILAGLAAGGSERLGVDFLLTEPLDAGRGGGIAPILVSTLLVLAVCLAVAVPIGVGAASALVEFGGEGRRLAGLIRGSLDVLSGVPSIVFALFGNAFFCQALGMGYSIASGGLTLACMVLPLVIRATEEGLRAVPPEQRLAAAALGLSRTATLLHVMLPAAAPGLVVGLVLGIARALTETAALLFTSGFVSRWPASLLDSGRTLSVHIYDLAMNVPAGEASAYASALVLVVFLLVLNMVASNLSRAWLKGRVRP